MKDSLLPQGALIEFVSQGEYVKVSAVDPVTKIEVSIVGDPASGKETLQRTAVRKLEYVLRKQGRPKDGPTRKRNSQSGWDL